MYLFTYYVEQIFISSLAICIYPWKCLFKSFVNGVYFFVDELQKFFIVHTWLLSVIWLANIFLYVDGCVFAFLIFLWYTEILHLNLVTSLINYLMFVPLVSCMNLLQDARSWRLIPVFSTESFIDYDFIFIFRPLILNYFLNILG